MHQVTFLPCGRTVKIDGDTTLREAAHLVGVNVYDRCGGIGACCNCIVTLVEGMENTCARTHLEAAVFYLEEQDRLSCQCRITGDVVVKAL